MVGVQFLVIMSGFSAEVDQEGEKVLSVWKKAGMKAQTGLIKTSRGTVCAHGCLGL